MLVNYAVITYLDHKLTAVGTEKFPVLARHYWFTSLVLFEEASGEMYISDAGLFFF